VLQRGDVLEFEEVVPGPGGPRTLLAIKFPLRNRQDELYAVGGICTDISRQKRAEQHQRQEVDRRDQFLAMLSHELRNPLGAILNATYLLEQDIEGRMADEAREVIGRQSRHMARLLDDLLDVSRITQNKIAIRKHVIDLRDTVEDALHAIGPVVDARAQELAVELPDEPLYVEGDPARLQQIQVNLLNNAAKYTPPGERISLSLTHDDTNAIITVRDTGIGIPPDMLEGIFDLFVQANDVQEQDMGGMGVGLTLVRSLVELHGGTVVAASEGLGKGSEFRVTLPIAKKRRRNSGTSPDHSAPMQADVLIIEDNEDSREMLQALLELHGLRVRTASDGIAGLAAIEEEPPDVALVDIGLPGLDGYEVARRVRRDLGDSQTMLIALTGFGQRADREAAIRAGFDEHLIKPLQFDELRRIFTKRFSRA
jgi:two-component system CheB/CheR fusion protein